MGALYTMARLGGTGHRLDCSLRPACAGLHVAELLGSLQGRPGIEPCRSAARAETLVWAS